MCEFFRKINKELEPVNRWLGFIVLVVGTIWGLNIYIHNLITETIKSPEMVELVSSKIRPVVIFDSEKRIISGENALRNFLDDFYIRKEGKKIKEIIIETKRLLKTAPILECLDGNFVIDVERDEKFRWKYTLGEVNAIVAENSAKPKEILRFRLEFLD